MTPDEDRRTDLRGGTLRLIKAALPLVIVCVLLWSLEPSANTTATVGVVIACAFVLWFGWSSIRRNIGTKLFGILLAVYLGFVLCLFLLGIAERVIVVLLPVFFLALPVLIYDLLFRAPHKGRFERARAERRHLRS